MELEQKANGKTCAGSTFAGIFTRAVAAFAQKSKLLPLRNHSHLPKSCDAIFQWWVRTEQRAQHLASKQRLNDAQSGGTRRQRSRRDPLIVRPQFLQGADQPV